MPKLNPYLIPKENIPKTEEIRYLENTEQEQKSTSAESIKKAIIPTVHASSEDEEIKESVKELESGAIIGSGTIVGAATLNPGTGAAAAGSIAGALKGVGKVEKFIGGITDNERIKQMGEVHDEGSTKALDEAGRKMVGK